MYDLWISVARVEGACSGPVPMSPGRGFLVRDGCLTFPDGGPICLFALQSLIPLLPAKEREVCESWRTDWLWRVDEMQCPDPKGRVVWRVERRPFAGSEIEPGPVPEPEPGDLIVRVEDVRGVCTSGMRRGWRALLRGSSLYLPQPFCLYALQATVPLLPAMQRRLDPDDWMTREHAVICPDPAGNVILRIERI